MERFGYIIPINEHNQGTYSWCKVGQFYAHLYDENGPYDGETFDTFDEAEKELKAMASEMGWTEYQISVDE